MKNTIKVLGIIALTAIIGFSMIACDNGGDDGGGTPVAPIIFTTFTSIADFATWLAEQPDNTAITPYAVKLDISSLGGGYAATGSVGKTLIDNSAKYVNLDLSGSTFTSFASYDLYQCASLTSITIPASVTSIAGQAFADCTSLTAITVASGNTDYISDQGVLYNKDKTVLVVYPAAKTGTTFSIPNSVTGIAIAAFRNCTLTGVTIPNGVTSIGNDGFYLGARLTSINIPASVTSIGTSVFSGCTSLTAITVDPGNTNYSSDQGVLYNKDKTLLVAYPVAKTGTTFTIPASVTSIVTGAFSRAAFTSITIPASVTSIGNTSFYGCANLTSVTFEGANTTIGSDLSFPNGASLWYAYPAGGIGTYKLTGETWAKE